MLPDEWLEIYSLRETLTKNFEVNSTNVTESNERTYIRKDERIGENYIPLGKNAGGINILNGIKVTEQTRFSKQKFQRDIIP